MNMKIENKKCSKNAKTTESPNVLNTNFENIYDTPILNN